MISTKFLANTISFGGEKGGHLKYEHFWAISRHFKGHYSKIVNEVMVIDIVFMSTNCSNTYRENQVNFVKEKYQKRHFLLIFTQ